MVHEVSLSGWVSNYYQNDCFRKFQTGFSALHRKETAFLRVSFYRLTGDSVILILLNQSANFDTVDDFLLFISKRLHILFFPLKPRNNILSH